MKKQKPKKQAAVKRYVAKPKQAVPKAELQKPKPKAKPKKSSPVTVVPPSVTKSDVLSESDNAVAETAVQTVKFIPSWLTDEVSELIEELIVTASPKLASTVSRLAYVLCNIMPALQPVSERADIVLCRKNGVTFGWDRRAEENRAVHSGKRQKSIAIS